MNLARRSLRVILPVVLTSNLLIACAVYWLQRGMIEDLETTRFATRMERLATAFANEVGFTRNLIFSMLAGETVRKFVREDNPEFQIAGLGVRLQDGIRFLSGETDRFVSFAIVAPDGSVAYYFENSEDPFAEIRPEQLAIARRLLDGQKASSDEYVPGDDGGLVVHSQLVDRRTFETPLATQRDFSYVIQSAVRPTQFAALAQALEADYGATVRFGKEDAASIASATLTIPVTRNLVLRGDLPEGHLAASLDRLKAILVGGSIALGLLSIGLLIFLIRRTVTGPIARLDHEVKEVIDGTREELSGTEHGGEVGRLSTNIKSMHDDAMRALRHVRELTWTDPLTGIGNRPRFHVAGQEWMAASQRGEAFSLLFVDLDNFKRVNDTFGHAAGDAVLKAFAAGTCHIAASWRERGIEAFPARLAGDEFALLVRGGKGVATHLASDILTLFADGGLEADGRIYPVSASIGIAVAPTDTAAFDELISRADAAMYRAKATGRNRYCAFEASEHIGSDQAEEKVVRFRELRGAF